MDSRTYWKQREAEQLKHNISEEAAYQGRIKDIYSYMLDQIQKEINGFYTKYAKKEGITLAEAKKRVAEADIKAYGRKAEKYVKEKNFSQKANEEMRLYNATMKINRLELLKSNIGLELVDGFNELEECLGDALTDRARGELRRQARIHGNTVADTERAVHAIVNASFHNANFSDRIWMHQDMMKAELDKLLRQGLIQGKHPRELSRHLVKLFGVSRGNAERLMRTELARVQTEAQKQSFERNGFDGYEFIAVGSACPVCKALDGKRFKVKGMMPGENAPPMHPNCRCSTAACMDDGEFEEWLDRKEGMKLSDTTDKWANEARKELLKSEESIKNRGKEVVEVYSASGEYILTKRGGASSVRLSVLDYKKLKNAVVTHNHPSGGSFSTDDIKFLKRTPISELRVITNDCVYFIRKPDEWPKEINNGSKIEAVMADIKNKLKPKYQKMYNEREIDRKQRHQMLSDEANRIFAERYGLKYGRETFK